jgi:hypothetical protein
MEEIAMEWLHNQLVLNLCLCSDDWETIETILEKAKEKDKQQRIDLLTKYHDKMFFIPFTKVEAERIYNYLNTIEK